MANESETIEEDIDGCIHSIHVRNFFCHENLEIHFNKNVNFIVGRNGSGKSAILTALVVGLGGRASATNRGSNLHSFIRKGANSATVMIKIKNSSAKAYKHHVYGDFITVVRNISASGGSSYKVKSASGDTISTRYEEVNAITTAHDIQVDNPISVLNQDDARSFHASDSKKKYSLFRKATNMDQTESNYIRAIENCEKATAIWKRKHEACIQLEKEFKKWEACYEQLQSRDEIEAHKQSLQNEYYWSEIAELERECSTIQAQFDKQKTKIDKLVDRLKEMEDNVGSNNDVLSNLQAQLEENTSEKSSVETRLRALEQESRALTDAWRQTQRAAGKHGDVRNREMRKIADLEREINNIEAGNAASRRAELQQRADRAAAEAESVGARFSTAQHEAAQAQQNAARAAAQHEQSAARAAQQRDRLKQLKQQLRELESRSDDSLAVYGRNMVELCQRIREVTARGGFSAPPRGPVGAYLKVKEKKWGGALEHIIGGSIQAFCVNTPEDSRKLFEIMGKVYGSAGKPSVTCSKFLDKRHDVRRTSVRARGFSSALDALQVTDTVVANFLIDNVGMERILLVPNHEDAVRLSDNVENVPENCSKIVTLDSTEYHPAPNYRSYGGAGRASRFLHLSTAERKKQVETEIAEQQETLASLEAEAERLAGEAKQAREHERQASRAVQALLGERHEREAAARAATSALEQHRAPHHDVLVEELEVSKRKLESLESQIEEATQTEQEHKLKSDECDARMRKLKNKLTQLNAACRALSEQMDQEQLKLDRGATERQTCAQKLKEDKTKLGQVERILEDKRGVIDQKTTQALALCPRIENPREKNLVCNELKTTQLKLSSIRSDGLTKAQVAERLLEMERKYRRAKRMLDRLQALIAEVKKTSDLHLKFCHSVQISIARRVQHCFQSILTLRGYSGRMDIDNTNGVLDIFCSGRESSKRRVASSTSSLSGGERSYSTVAFVMSLWECVELPFYFLDEFDVFMDNVNRKIVMELLIDHALTNTSRQFVFLTPQDASSVTAGPRVKIHRMADPRS